MRRLPSFRGSFPLARRFRGAHGPRKPFRFAHLTVVLAFGVLALRLWQLQIADGDRYLRRSADNFVKEIVLPAPRGRILDRAGNALADNRPAYSISVTPRFADDTILEKVAGYLGLDGPATTSLKEKVSAHGGADRSRALLVAEDVSRDQVALIESDKLLLPGVQVAARARRTYPKGAFAAHAVGYLGQIGADELSERRGEGYRSGDLVGRAGIERQWEAFLRGKDGVDPIIVDAKGQRIGDSQKNVELAQLLGDKKRTEPQPGLDIVTTFDVDLQRSVEKAIAKHRSAAAVVLEVETGRVLALASHPGFDPNLLSSGISHLDLEALRSDPLRPLVDKTTRENYFPGSTFKVVPMIAALADHSIDPDAKVHCKGSINYGHRAFHCVEAHGPVNLDQALAQSCNVYFYGLGDALGLDRMAEVASDLGFGASSGLGLNGEVPGFLPTTDYYKKTGGFQKGFVLNTAIGQGSVEVTVLQLAAAYAAIANGGKLYVPQLIARIERPAGAPGSAGNRVVQAFAPRLRHQLTASATVLARVRRALAEAVSDPKGTSYSARVPGLDVAGKTGTAQIGKARKLRPGEAEEGAQSNDHAWFASFAPTQKPEIAVVVLVEHGGFGAKVATPTAMRIYQAYFKQRQAKLDAAPGDGTKVAAAK